MRYTPDKLPVRTIDWGRFIKLIASANFEIGRYDGILRGIINPNVFLSPLTTQEAVLSSKIEGTQASLAEVLEYEASDGKVDKQKSADINEILNYRSAINKARIQLKKKPISLNVILDIHRTLLDGVRGQSCARGKFRTVQNWIGTYGCKMEEARFVPPPPGKIMEYFLNLEKYMNIDEKDTIIQLAVIHAQFEIIHPFIDGNGRVGRILVPLFLYEKKSISAPVFYISSYFEKNRNEYYQRLNNISKNKDWNGWIEFFLKAVTEQAIYNTQRASKLILLYENMKKKINKIVPSQFSIQILDSLFSFPIFMSSNFAKRSKIPKASAFRILKRLHQNEIIHKVRKGQGRRPSLYVYKELIEIIERKSLVSK